MANFFDNLRWRVPSGELGEEAASPLRPHGYDPTNLLIEVTGVNCRR